MFILSPREQLFKKTYSLVLKLRTQVPARSSSFKITHWNIKKQHPPRSENIKSLNISQYFSLGRVPFQKGKIKKKGEKR